MTTGRVFLSRHVAFNEQVLPFKDLTSPSPLTFAPDNIDPMLLLCKMSEEHVPHDTNPGIIVCPNPAHAPATKTTASHPTTLESNLANHHINQSSQSLHVLHRVPPLPTQSNLLLALHQTMMLLISLWILQLPP